MALHLTVDVVLDVDEWDEKAEPGQALHEVAQAIAASAAGCEGSTGCDLYGRYPVQRDGACIGSWSVWNATTAADQ